VLQIHRAYLCHISALTRVAEAGGRLLLVTVDLFLARPAVVAGLKMINKASCLYRFSFVFMVVRVSPGEVQEHSPSGGGMGGGEAARSRKAFENTVPVC